MLWLIAGLLVAIGLLLLLIAEILREIAEILYVRLYPECDEDNESN